jgi:ribosomal protein L11 methyltransferase
MRAFVVLAPHREVEVASDVLWGLGVRAVEERTGDVVGSVELWTSVGEADDAIERAVAALQGRWEHRVVEVADVDVDAAQRWRDFASPMWVDDGLVVVPAWQDAPESAAPVTAVHVEPAGAFGLGDHPTTLMSLRAVARLLRSEKRVDDVIDVGCGTGVIAVAAALLLGRPVRAVDVASAAVEATIDNARRNGVEDLVDVDAAPLGEIDGGYDLVVANILAPALVSLADDLGRVTRADGRLVISGILADSHQHVLDALAPMQALRTDTLDGWACVELRHP